MNTIREAREEDFAAVRGPLADQALIHEDFIPTHLATCVVLPAQGHPSALLAMAAALHESSARGGRDGCGQGRARTGLAAASNRFPHQHSFPPK